MTPTVEVSRDGTEAVERASEGYVVNAWRKCQFCKRFFELDGQVDEDSRQVCDRECALSLSGRL